MKAVLLANMGAPVSEKEMKVFLKRMFMDKAIIYAPFVVRFMFANIISNLRYKSSWQKYLQIGGSPLQKSMNHMATDLQQILGEDYEVSAVYSYSEPFIELKIAELNSRGINDISVISMYPQASFSTTGSVQTSLDKLKRKYNELNLYFVEDYFKHELFIQTWVELIQHKIGAMQYANPHLLFSSHAIPASFIERGDLYVEKMQVSAALIAEKLALPYSLSYQSKIGPTAWTRPYTIDQLKELSAAGVNEIVVVPLSFINENLETRYDLDTELIPFALNELGIKDICRIVIPESNAHLIKMFYEFETSGNLL